MDARRELPENMVKTLIDAAFHIGRSKTNESLRLATMQAVKKLVPFYAGAFFLVNPDSFALGSSLLFQPVGKNVLSDAISTSIPKPKGFLEQDKTVFSRIEADNCALDSFFLMSCWFTVREKPLGVIGLCRDSKEDPFDEGDVKRISLLRPSIERQLDYLRAGEQGDGIDAQTLKTEFGLTKREIDVMQCVSFGMSPLEIARKLSISIATARKHLEHIYKKTGVNDMLSLMKVSQLFLGRR